MDNHSSSLQPASALLPAPSHPSPFTIIQYLKESYQFAIIQEESSKPLITPWPCNPWPFTLLLLTHCCYPILPRRFGVQHISQGRKPVHAFFPMKKCCTLQCWSSPEDWSLSLQTCLILIQSGHHHEVHHTHPCSQGEIRVLQGTFSSYLSRLEIEVHAFRVTVIFVTENSFDLSLISANSASD